MSDWVYDATTATWRNRKFTNDLIETAMTVPVEGGLTTPCHMEMVQYFGNLQEEFRVVDLTKPSHLRLAQQFRQLIARGVPMENPHLRAGIPTEFGQKKHIVWYDDGRPETDMRPNQKEGEILT